MAKFTNDVLVLFGFYRKPMCHPNLLFAFVFVLSTMQTLMAAHVI